MPGRVDDILFAGNRRVLVGAGEIWRPFRPGETERLTQTTPIALLRLLLEMQPIGEIATPQTHYEKDPQQPDAAAYIKSGSVIGGEEFRTAMRQSIGSSIWARQTRPDVGYNIAKIATDAFSARQSGDVSRKLITLYNKTFRYLHNYTREIHLSPDATIWATSLDQWADVLTARIIAYHDAGFVSIRDSHIVEEAFIVLGRVITRDGIIKCHGAFLVIDAPKDAASVEVLSMRKLAMRSLLRDKPSGRK